MKWKIGTVEIPNRFVLAPMAGVTDLAFRRLCKEQGAGLLCMEMISAKAISYKNKNTRALMEIDPVEHPISMQLFGSEPELMTEVAKEIEEEPFDILDINMGCPVPKVVNNGEGSALLKRTEEVIRSYFVDTVIFSCKALDENWGVMESQEAFGTAKRAMLDSGRKKILVVDNTKFDQTAFSVAGRLRDVDIVVTDVKPSEKWLKLFKEEGVECRYPESVR